MIPAVVVFWLLCILVCCAGMIFEDYRQRKT